MIERCLVPRDKIWQNALNGVEFVVYLSLMNLCYAYDKKVIVTDEMVLYNITQNLEDLKNPHKRKLFKGAMQNLGVKGVVSYEELSKGKYLVDCAASFREDLPQLRYGYVYVKMNNIRKIVQAYPDSRQWQGIVVYYFEVLCHVGKGGGSFSLKFISEKIGISELTISKYNGILQRLGLLKIQHMYKSTSRYFIGEE